MLSQNVNGPRELSERESYQSERFFTVARGADLGLARSIFSRLAPRRILPASRVYVFMVCVCTRADRVCECLGAIVHSNKNKLPERLTGFVTMVVARRNGMGSGKDVQLKTIMANTFQWHRSLARTHRHRPN